jgi:four helix bundle protein
MSAKDHRELRVHQLAFESAIKIHELTKSFPDEERYSLTDQVRRSSRSICANIAEAWRKRRYPKSFVRKLRDDDAEAT